MGKILHIAEGYFGLADTELAMEMQKKAMDKEPGNLLYAWAYKVSCWDIEEGFLANQLLEHEKGKVDCVEIRMSDNKIFTQEAIRVIKSITYPDFDVIYIKGNFYRQSWFLRFEFSERIRNEFSK
jgi:SHS2 domain-containing protein